MKPYAQRGELNLYRVKARKERKVLSLKPATKIFTSYEVQKVVSEYMHIPIDLMNSNTRKREIVLARQMAMFFSKNFTKSSLSTIGNDIGGKDHATVLHACKTVNNLMDTDKLFKLKIDEIYTNLNKEI
jgi:chromosomal replication initiation ATPase DnaA